MKEKSKSVLQGLAGGLVNPEDDQSLPVTQMGYWKEENGDWIWIPYGTDGLPLREGKLNIPVVPKVNGS